MNKSESISKIAAAFLKAQKDIRSVLKDSNNPFFKSKYADLTNIIDAVKVPLNNNGITFIQGTKDCEDGICVETMFLHESGEWLSSDLRMPVDKRDAQKYGSAITYARRYSLQSMCGVPSEDDDGNAASKGNNGRNGPSNPTTGVYESLNSKSKNSVENVANSIIRAWGEEEKTKCLDLWKNRSFSGDADLSTACWSLIKDSKIRKYLKDSLKEKGE